MSSINASKKVATPASLDAVEPQGVTEYDSANASRKVASPSSLKSNVTKWIPTPAFSPLDLSPTLWLDASDESTLSGPGGGAVSQWNDKSGNGYDLTQGTATNQPTTGIGTQNGLNVISFDGSDLLVAATASDWTFLHDGSDHTLFVVSKRPSSGTAMGLLATANAGGSRLGLIVIQTDSLFQHLLYGTVNTITVNNAPTVSTQNWQIGVIDADPDNVTASARSTISVNGGADQTANTATGAVSGTAPNHPLTIGSYGGGSNALLGDIAEIIVVDGTLTADEISRVENYLADKWGITI